MIIYVTGSFANSEEITKLTTKVQSTTWSCLSTKVTLFYFFCKFVLSQLHIFP